MFLQFVCVATCTLFCFFFLLALIYTLNITWLVVFCRLDPTPHSRCRWPLGNLCFKYYFFEILGKPSRPPWSSPQVGERLTWARPPAPGHTLGKVWNFALSYLWARGVGAVDLLLLLLDTLHALSRSTRGTVCSWSAQTPD